MAIRFPRITAAKRQKALAEAEEEFKRIEKRPAKQKHIKLRTSDIKERPALFQPREFSHGARTVNPDRVRELSHRINIHGELDPVLVMRLGKEWVVVDGHHRIAAYRSKHHKKPIKCEWFGGTPTEAVDEAMRRNQKDTLPLHNADKREEAWRRVVLGQGSVRGIAKACSISSSTVQTMRNAKGRYETDPDYRERVGRPLMETSWGIMLLANSAKDPTDHAVDEKARRLAKIIQSRLTDLLKRNAEVTARALQIHSPILPRALMDVWTGRMAIPAPRELTPPELHKQIEVLKERICSFGAMLAQMNQRTEERLEAAQQAQDEAAEMNSLKRFLLSEPATSPEEVQF